MKALIAAILIIPAIVSGQTLTTENGQAYIVFDPPVSFSDDAIGTLKVSKLRIEMVPPITDDQNYLCTLSGEYNVTKKLDKENTLNFNGYLNIQLKLSEKAYLKTDQAGDIRGKVLAKFLKKFQALSAK